MTEIEVAEEIEKHIDIYIVDKDGKRALGPSADEIRASLQATSRRPVADSGGDTPRCHIVLADGKSAAPEGLDGERGI